MCSNFDVIGIPDSPRPLLSPEAREAIRSGNVFSGGKRHHELMRELLPREHVWIDVAAPLENTLSKYSGHDSIVVFASGDPLFFGYAATLKRKFPEACIRVFPSFNSLQTLAHRLNLNYEEMVCVSLTGRPWRSFWETVIAGNRLIGVLTDRKNTPSEIARQLLKYGYTDYEISVGSHLGNPEKETVGSLSLEEAASSEYDFPNSIILKAKTGFKRRLRTGIPDSMFEHLPGREKMITKMPVRLLSLAMLDLSNRNSLWDIGFCTGSISIEARLMFPHLSISSFEKRRECEGIMQRNMTALGAPGISYTIDDFFSLDLSQYPRPDAVFIGGHGGRLSEMLKIISGYALPGCVIVFNSVSEESKMAFLTGISLTGKTVVESHTISLDNFNPITILKAQ